MDGTSERRQYSRIFFTKDHDIKIKFTIKDIRHGPIEANILNISPGGFFLTLTGRDRKIVKKDDIITVKEIQRENKKPHKLNLEAKIIWILDNAQLDYIGIGTEFINLDDPVKKQIENFIIEFKASSPD
jgi:c-di-GMP-binding flagellar brake protein YcgR